MGRDPAEAPKRSQARRSRLVHQGPVLNRGPRAPRHSRALARIGGRQACLLHGDGSAAARDAAAQNRLSCSPGGARRAEMLGRERDLVDVEAEPGAGGFDALADHPGIGAAAGHALAESRVVVLAAAGLADQREDVALAIGEIGLRAIRGTGRALRAAAAASHSRRISTPQAAAASRMRSISASLIAGMIGATITVVGTPAAPSSRSAASRRGGLARAAP